MFNLISKNHWYIRAKLSDEMISDIKYNISLLEQTKDNEANHFLAGKIDKEYFIEIPISVKEFIFDMIKEYKEDIIKSTQLFDNKILNLDSFSYTPTNTNSKFKYQSWVNFQKKYEYNPAHNHDGDYSYVIWYKIPYNKFDERVYGVGSKSHSKTNGNFTFYFVNDENKVDYINISNDSSDNGTLLIFPSTQIHSVNPFYTSDDYRITLSGNINEIKKPYNII